MSITSEESQITTVMEEPKKDTDSKIEDIVGTIKREHDSTDDFERVEPENLLGELSNKKKDNDDENADGDSKEVKGEVKKEEEKEKEEKEKGEKKEGGGLVEEEKAKSEGQQSSVLEPPRVQEDHPVAADSMDPEVQTKHEQLPTCTIPKRTFLNEQEEREVQKEEELGKREELEEEEKALPATPPPSADIEKYDSMADPFQRPAGRTTSAEGFNPKAATVAFVEIERTASAPPPPPPHTLPTSNTDNNLLLDFSDNNIHNTVTSTSNINKDALISSTIATTAPVSDQTKMNDDQSSNLTKKDMPEKENLSSFEPLDSDSTHSSTTPSAPVIKSNKESTDIVLSSSHDSSKELADDLVTSNDQFSADHWAFKDTNETVSTISDNVNDIVKDTTAIKTEPTQITNTKILTSKRTDQKDDKTSNSTTKSESKTVSSISKLSTQDDGKKDARYNVDKPENRIQDIEIAPKEIFRDMGLVATLIYWRDPKKSGAVFGATLGLLLSLAYFSLISVLAYLSLLILVATVAFRIYKSVLQAIQKTSDGHPFKYVLDLDLTLPTEKVHELADIAVAHVNATISELRRLFLVEDIVDSLKFGVLLWCFTYIGSWFNGMTLIIIGVVALFTLPKVYETNKTQIDENLALVKGKVDEFTAKIKAAIPLVKKPEPTKED
ncbi:PREDICTED: reticulon-4 isoform X2 [Polistes dominula]|uniref:Reticulon-like protein n=1 Tax=Polistes dominula TaxID=743375 RepID=A0ABM1IKD8_POLDO|nr:PREDICTED: reticulon-4 isoform X2 [Polistes dominula]